MKINDTDLEETMERLTREIAQKTYVTDGINVKPANGAYAGKAIDRLARFENFYENLKSNQEEVIRKMEPLRKEGKTETVTFRRLMAEKIMNENLISRLGIYGIE